MKLSERIRLLKEYSKEYAERIKTNQTIPEKLKRKVLAFNRGLIKEAKRYLEALEVLENSKKLLEKMNKGKLTKEQYNAKIRHAREQKEEIEIFVQQLSKIIKQKKGKKDLPQILLSNERELKSALL